jgi:RHS repeat-associated protein
MKGFTFTVGSTPTTLTGAVGWNANWTLGTLGLTDGFNAANTQNCSYGYDALARVNGVNCVNGSTSVWNQSFTLDPFGNISKSGTSSFDASYLLTNGTTNNQEQSVGSCIPTYDASGNLTKDCSFANPHSYTWNAYNLPSTLFTTNVTYDALGREVEFEVSSSYSQILYSPIGKLGVMQGQTPVRTRFPLPGGSTAEITGVNSGYYILHADWLGTARLATSFTSRAMAEDVAYAPFGEYYANVGNIESPLNFTSQSQDTLSGLYDFLYREHNPVQGRWISPDPAGLNAVDITNPQSWNRYGYVSNSPLSNIDPSGLACYPIMFTFAHGCAPDETEGVTFGQSWNPFATVVIAPASGALYDGPLCWNCTVVYFAFLSDGMTAANNGPQQPQNPQPPQPSRLNQASKAALHTLVFGQAIGTGVGCGVGALVAAGATAATETYPLAGATVPAGCVGGGIIGFFEALPYSTLGAIADFGWTYWGH